MASYFGDEYRDRRALVSIIDGLKRQRDKAIDEVLKNKDDVDNAIDDVVEILDIFEDDAFAFAVEFTSDPEEVIRDDLRQILYM